MYVLQFSDEIKHFCDMPIYSLIICVQWLHFYKLLLLFQILTLYIRYFYG